MNTTTSTIRRFAVYVAIILGVIAAAVALALSGATAAKADAQTLEELAFISVLDDEGIYYSSEDAALTVGYGICDAFDSGASFWQVVAAGVSATEGGYSAGDVGFITGVSVGAFCPEYAYIIEGVAA